MGDKNKTPDTPENKAPDTKGVSSGVEASTPAEDTPVDVAASTGGGKLHAIGNGLKLGVGNAVHKCVSIATGGVSKVGSFLHIGNKAATALTLCVILAGGGTAAMSIGGNIANDLLVKQEHYEEDDCAEDVDASRSNGTGVPNGDMEEYAAKAWAVGKAIGMTDEQCAGMLGNMQTESQMDPTTIESIYDEPFNIDAPKKSAAMSDLCAFTTTTMRQAYINSGFAVRAHTSAAGCYMAPGGSGTGLHSPTYEGLDGHFFPGIGLFGFTGVEASNLVAYATAANRDWWDFDVQMAFIIDTTGGYSRAPWVSEWISGQNKPGSPSVAADEWNINFEGNSSNFASSTRQANAIVWFARFAGTNGDASYAQSILALADTVAGGAAGSMTAQKEDECAEATKVYDNADLARAAVAYAYRTTDLGRGNNGTQLYVAVHDAVHPGDTYYMSCDRGVTTAIRWAGYDDACPAGSTNELDTHFSTSAHWEDLGVFGEDMTIDDLEPGDVLNTPDWRRVSYDCGHIVVYVSNEIVREKFPDSDASFVSASLGDRSPGCETYTDGKFFGDGYHVYRNILKEENSAYTNVVEGLNLDDGSGQ